MECYLLALSNGEIKVFKTKEEAIKNGDLLPYDYKVYHADLKEIRK